MAPAVGAFAGENGKIAFVSDRRGADFDIWAMNPDGTGLVNLTQDSNADEFGPNWRADGRKLAFNSDRATGTNPEGDHEMVVMNADGSQVRQITFNALDDEDPGRSVQLAQGGPFFERARRDWTRGRAASRWSTFALTLSLTRMAHRV